MNTCTVVRGDEYFSAGLHGNEIRGLHFDGERIWYSVDLGSVPAFHPVPDRAIVPGDVVRCDRTLVDEPVRVGTFVETNDVGTAALVDHSFGRRIYNTRIWNLSLVAPEDSAYREAKEQDEAAGTEDASDECTVEGCNWCVHPKQPDPAPEAKERGEDESTPYGRLIDAIRGLAADGDTFSGHELMEIISESDWLKEHDHEVRLYARQQPDPAPEWQVRALSAESRVRDLVAECTAVAAERDRLASELKARGLAHAVTRGGAA